MASAPEADAKYSQAYLPDFCAAGTILVILLVAELVAIVLTLASYEPGAFLTELSKVSMYLLWLALLGAALMCRIRPWAGQQGSTQAFVVCFVLLEILCLMLAEITYRLTVRFGEGVIIDDIYAGFMLKTFATSSIVIALAMRYLYIASEWRRSIVLEAHARISALQALIRPHFLFNSMNTIASLTKSNPKLAEEAVEDLVGLFRANLNATKDRATLEEELEVAAVYQRIEKLRLGDRLTVCWDVGDLPMQALMPSLTIQPLLKTRSTDGIEMLPDGGVVSITGKRVDNDLRISIHNPVAPGQSRREGGHQMAMSNIRQRFELAYGNRATVDVQETDTDYRVQLQFPCDEVAA